MLEERCSATIHCGSHREEGRGDDLGGHGTMVSHRRWQKRAWVEKRIGKEAFRRINPCIIKLISIVKCTIKTHGSTYCVLVFFIKRCNKLIGNPASYPTCLSFQFQPTDRLQASDGSVP
jgi:hypothetical protein